MRAVAHGWKPTGLKHGPTRAVAQEFVQAKDRGKKPAKKAFGGPLRLMGRQPSAAVAGRMLGRGQIGPLATADRTLRDANSRLAGLAGRMRPGMIPGRPMAMAKGGKIKPFGSMVGKPPSNLPAAVKDVKVLSSHPDAEELATHFGVKQDDIYDAFSSIGQHVGNVPRRSAVEIVRAWLAGET